MFLPSTPFLLKSPSLFSLSSTSRCPPPVFPPSVLSQAILGRPQFSLGQPGFLGNLPEAPCRGPNGMPDHHACQGCDHPCCPLTRDRSSLLLLWNAGDSGMDRKKGLLISLMGKGDINRNACSLERKSEVGAGAVSQQSNKPFLLITSKEWKDSLAPTNSTSEVQQGHIFLLLKFYTYKT